MISYLLKFSACLAVFMLFYKFFLEKESFHKFKRGYLLVILIISAIIPLITFITYVEIASIEIPAYNSEIATPPYVPEHMLEGSAKFWSIILWSVYLIGVLVFTIRFGMNLSNILKRIKHNPKFKNHSVIHVLLNDLVHPHTFLNYIFLNKSKYEAHEIPEEVLLHEETHAKQKHALDILFIEILQILFWFNPLIYFIKKDIKLNHEFLADQAVLNHGFELKKYQNTLLAFSSNATEPQLANAMNYSSIKKRFTVMKTHTSKHIIWVRSLVLLPLLATLIYSFSTTKEVEKISNSHDTNHTARSISVNILDNENYLIDDIAATKETFTSVINKLHQDISKEIREKIINVHVKSEKSVSDEDVWFIYNSFIEYGFHRIVTHNQEIVSEKGNKPFAIEKNNLIQTNPLTKIYGRVCDGCELSLTKEDLEKLTIETNTKEPIISFNIKFSEKPTVNVTGNRLNSKAISYLNNSKSGDYIQLFHLKTATTLIKTPTTPVRSPVVIKLIDKSETSPSVNANASKEQIAEYNKLAKYYNSQKGSNYTIKLSDMNRIKYLYDLMTDKQRKSAEPLPNFPPPPPPAPAPEAVSEKDKAGKAHTYKYTDENGKAVKVEVVEKNAKTPPPPPPPVPENATKEQKEKYQKISEEYYKKYKVENGKVSEREPLPSAPKAPKASAPKPPKAPEVIEVVEEHNIPSPSSTKSAFEFVQSLKNDDITYYYNKKKVSYDEILKIVKKEPNINISTNIKNNKGTVKFWSVK
ncbi:M56 family metallopeptidase [Corallibacter sp.]|uniref:M56 family metallopeptidase n=1 Tax=Corallibacter sp. TaxID=2038084 RepID=UPI003AB833AF